jgi:SAM-dependent methyltransferase
MVTRKNKIYDAVFYECQAEKSSDSASSVVPVLINLIQPESVIDIGCGVGTWLQFFREFGVGEILGIDGDYIDRKRLRIPEDCFLGMDLSNPVVSIGRSYDLALCLEVAEHIPERSAHRLVDFITSLAPVAFFSAAVPGQGGTGHVNEQWPDYWGKHFADHGYKMLDVIRPKIWNMEHVEPWYCQNSFLYVREDNLSCFPDLVTINTDLVGLPKRIIHPELFRRFASLEYVQSKQLICELIARVKRRLRRVAS